MIIKKTVEQIEGIREAGKIVAEAIFRMAQEAVPGNPTQKLENIAKQIFEKYGAQSAFLGYRPSRRTPAYPAYVCISLNDVIVHGIPGPMEIRPGDLVSVDVGVRYNGFVGDAAATYIVQGASPKAETLAKETYNALHKGIDAARPGGKISDISAAIQKYIEVRGYSVVRDLVGHGVGIQLHEEPQVPNFVDSSMTSGDIPLEPGMTIAIEPMVCEKDYKTTVDNDGWSVRTADGGLSAHFEHTIAINENGIEILTLMEDGSEPYVP
ncbi:type I methionyl aminopeptidase [bacterium]|nr:MAG: type I methionyl aminopeptidase [bacterium]